MMKGCKKLDKIIDFDQNSSNSEFYELYLKKREAREEKMQACVLDYDRTTREAKEIAMALIKLVERNIK